MGSPYSRAALLNPIRRPATNQLLVATLATVVLIASSQTRSAAQQPQAPQLIFSPWVKLCNKGPQPNAKRVCVTAKDGRIEAGTLVVSATIIEIDGEQRKLMRIALPYGLALKHGTRAIVDQGAPATAPFITCLPPNIPPGGCISDYEASADLISRMKKGRLLTVQAIQMNGQAMSPQLELKDFAKAYDGPPTDPKAYEKLREEQLKRFKDDGLWPRPRPKP